MTSLRESMAGRGIADLSAGLRAQQPYLAGEGDVAEQHAKFPYRSLRALIASGEWPDEWSVRNPRPSPGYLDYPKRGKSSDMAWGDSLNGVTHDEENWYFSTVIRSHEGLNPKFKARNAKLFRIPLSQNLDAGGGDDVSQRVPLNDEHGQPLAEHYCHYGDIDLHGDTLYVPLEGDDCGGA